MNEHMHKKESSNEQMEREWEDSKALFFRIYNSGLKNYFENIPTPRLKSAFELRDKSIRCIDEGTPGGIHIAGSGILLDTVEKKVSLDRAIEELWGAGVDGVYSHEHCGAANLYATQVGNPEKAKEYAIKWAEKMSKLLDVPYLGHIADLARPVEFHNARVAYYDGTGRFDPQGITEIPQGFVISRYYLDHRYAKDELAIALSIALGHHGFGEKFTKDNPFIIAPIEKGGAPREGMTLAELEKEALDVAHQYGDRVRVEGFKQPL